MTSGKKQTKLRAFMAEITNGEYENRPAWQRVAIYSAIAVWFIICAVALLAIVTGLVYSILIKPPTKSWGDCSVADCSGLNEYPY